MRPTQRAGGWSEALRFSVLEPTGAVWRAGGTSSVRHVFFFPPVKRMPLHIYGKDLKPLYVELALFLVGTGLPGRK